MSWVRLIDSMLFGIVVAAAYVLIEKNGFEARKTETE